MDRAAVVDRALKILGELGLPDLTMRRLGAELGVQQSALYHHFANKQALLGAVADEIVAQSLHSPVTGEGNWADQVTASCVELRAAVLSYPDGADVVSSMFAFGLGGAKPYRHLVLQLAAAGVPRDLVPVAAHTLLHFVYGHAVAQQAHQTAARLGAIQQVEGADGEPDHAGDFARGLELVVRGIATTLSS